MNDVRVESLGARVRQVRREAASRGMLVSKSRNERSMLALAPKKQMRDFIFEPF